MKDTGERLLPKLHEESLVYGEHLARYQAVRHLVKGCKVIDMASGAGYGSNIIAQSAKEVIGIDISKDAIKYAQKNYKAKNLKFLCSSATSVPLKDESVDIVISFETIEHIDQKQQVKLVNEASRLLKPTGTFIVSTPNIEEYPKGNPYHIHEFELAEFRQLLHKKFKNVDIHYQSVWLTSSLFEEETLQNKWEKNIKVIKEGTEAPRQATYFIALCSNAKKLTLDNSITITSRWSTKEYQESQLLISNNKYVINSLQTRLKQAEKDNKALLKNVNSIINSFSWKITKPLRVAKRLAKKKK